MFGRNKKVRGTTPSPKSNQNNPNYVRIILMLQRYNYFSIRQSKSLHRLNAGMVSNKSLTDF